MARPFDALPPHLVSHALAGAAGCALLLPGLGAGSPAGSRLISRLRESGLCSHELVLPGHGPEPWPLPFLTSLRDYADLARRAAGSLGRPLLLGRGLGGWLACKVLEQADLPTLLMDPWLGPRPGLELPGEPLRVRLELALGLCPARPRRPLAGPRCLALPRRKITLRQNSGPKLAARLGADIIEADTFDDALRLFLRRL